MALLEDLAKGVTPTGIAVSVGTVVLAPYLLPALSSALRPAARGVLSTGISLYRQTMEPVGRAMSGLVEEARAELAAASDTPAAMKKDADEKPAAKAPRRTHKDGGAHPHAAGA